MYENFAVFFVFACEFRIFISIYHCSWMWLFGIFARTGNDGNLKFIYL